MLQELVSQIRVVTLPMRTTFRGITTRESAFIEGPYGWGEFAPFLEYDAEESVPWLNSALEAAFTPRPRTYRDWVKVNATIPATNDPATIEILMASYQGCEVAKVKIGSDISQDLERIKRVRSIAPDIRLRFDVNGTWTVDQAIAGSYTLYENFGDIEYIEQPCSGIDELRELKERSKIDITICADELIRKSKEQVDLDGVADVIMLKVAPVGGISRAHEIADFHGKPIVISSALESAVGISYGAYCAASFEESIYAAGLGTGKLLADDVASLPIVNGEIEVKRIEPSFTHEAAVERRSWWQNRLRAVWDCGSGEFAERLGA